MNKRKQEKKIRNKQDKLWREQIKERDKVCVICGSKNKLNCHHILPKEIKETRTDVLNGILLCPAHHRFFKKQISAHQNPFAFYLFLQKNRPKQFKYLKEKWENKKY